MSDELVAEIIAKAKDAKQSGVKGMKWGVRRPRDPSTGLVVGSSKSTLKRALRGKGADDGSGVKTGGGLVPRTSSADKIAQDRIASKISKSGSKSLSNADIQAYTRRLQLEKDLSTVLAAQSAAQKRAADGFVKSFIKSQGSRQIDRVANKAIDIAVEKALESAGVKLGKKNPSFGKDLGELSKRLKPKKGK